MNDEQLIWEAYESSLEDPMNRVMFPDSKKKETVGEFINRHDLTIEDGYIILYHGTPKKTTLINGVIKAWSYFAKTPIESLHYSTRDRELKPSSVIIYKVRILPQELEYSGFYQTNTDISLKERTTPLKLMDILKDYLLDKGFVDLNNNPPKVNPNGTVTLYHNTKSQENANSIIKTRDWKSKEGKQIFFSTKPNINTTGYGNITLKVNVDPEEMILDDVFDNELHVWLSSDNLKKYPVSVL